MARRFFYSGDLNIEHGGYFYCLDTWRWGYVDALRVTPCSEAGGQDNVFWIERLTVNIREGEELAGVLRTCGIDELPKGAARRHALIDSHIAYGAYDADSVATLQIGKDDPFYGGREQVIPTHKVRAGRDLFKLARSIARGDKRLAELGVSDV